jgi:hypothetical protein
MAKAHLSLDATETVVLQAAATIYAAYVQRGLTHSDPHKNQEFHERAVKEAIELARLTDDAVQTESEFS